MNCISDRILSTRRMECAGTLRGGGRHRVRVLPAIPVWQRSKALDPAGTAAFEKV